MRPRPSPVSAGVCRGNATRAQLLAPRGHFQAPGMRPPRESARREGTCVVETALWMAVHKKLNNTRILRPNQTPHPQLP